MMGKDLENKRNHISREPCPLGMGKRGKKMKKQQKLSLEEGERERHEGKRTAGELLSIYVCRRIGTRYKG